jgi:hypothetical protein
MLKKILFSCNSPRKVIKKSGYKDKTIFANREAQLTAKR